jgi:aminoglycoside phosphotransferase (APT) family kinase protein
VSATEKRLREETLRHLRENGRRYFADAEGDLRLEIVREIRREASRVWCVDMTCGSSTLHLAVKKRTAAARQPSRVTQLTRYRVALVPPHAEQIEREGQALRQIEAFASGDDDPRIGGVHVYDALPQEDLLVMERAKGEELGRLLLRASRRGARGTPETLVTACRNAGVWLRKFHDVMPQNETRPVASDRAEFSRIADRKIAELERWLPDESGWRELRESIEDGLARAPEAFEAQATSHGDFWMGNVLCQPDRRVVVIDTFGAGRGPIYIDLAYFLIHLQATPPQIYSRGRWCRDDVLQASESAFLAGYDATRPPGGGPLALFQILVLLYKWASSTHNLERARGLKLAYERTRLAWRSRYFRQLIERYRAELEAPHLESRMCS